MITDPGSIRAALRQLPGVRDVDVVELQSEKELRVVPTRPVNLNGLCKASESLGGIVATLLVPPPSRLVDYPDQQQDEEGAHDDVDISERFKDHAP